MADFFYGHGKMILLLIPQPRHLTTFNHPTLGFDLTKKKPETGFDRIDLEWLSWIISGITMENQGAW